MYPFGGRRFGSLFLKDLTPLRDPLKYNYNLHIQFNSFRLYSFVKDMHVKRREMPEVSYDPEEAPLDMDDYQKEHYQFYRNRPQPIKGDNRCIGYYPAIPDLPLAWRPKYPDLPYDDPQDRRYIGEPVSLFLIAVSHTILPLRSMNNGKS
jgi:hypothetical protein